MQQFTKIWIKARGFGDQSPTEYVRISIFERTNPLEHSQFQLSPLFIAKRNTEKIAENEIKSGRSQDFVTLEILCLYIVVAW